MLFQVDLTAPDIVSSSPEPVHDMISLAAFSLLQYWISPWKYATLFQSTSKHTKMNIPYTLQTLFGTHRTF